MNKLSVTKKTYLVSGLLLVIISLGLIFIVIPLYTKITSFTQEIHDQRIQLAISQQERNNLEKTRRDFNKIKNDIEDISKMFITQDQFLDIISTFEIIASQNNIKQDISINNQNDERQNGELNMSISLSCGWYDCLNYLANLEMLDYYVVIDNLNITSNDDLLTVSFIAKTYEGE